MAISPGVQLTTGNRSQYRADNTGEVAAFVGVFERGPINTPILVNNINDFKFLFGRGIDEFAHDWNSVYNYLLYSDGIFVVRSSGSTRLNASNTYDIIIDKASDFVQSNVGVNEFVASTPGSWGNILKISIIHKTDYDNDVSLNGIIRAKEQFSFFEDGFVGICVFRNTSLVESFYIEEKASFNSLYFYTDTNGIINSAFDSNIITLSNGTQSTPTTGDIIESYTYLDDIMIDKIIGNQINNSCVIDYVETRKDCIAYVGYPTDELNDVIVYSKTLKNSQFVHFTSAFKTQTDIFTGKTIDVNIASDAAGLNGYGNIKNAIAIKKPSISYKELYKLGINYVTGRILSSQKSFTNINSAYSKINIRILANHVKRESEIIVRRITFEHNNIATRQRIAMLVKMYLVDLKTDRLIINGKVHVYPGTNNNTINVDIAIKPTYLSEVINIRVSNI